jgi:pyruvate dehydrogenase E1 component
VPWVTQCLGGSEGVVVAASDYVRVLPDGIDRWIPQGLTSLGTDGFGRSENRASLRDFFEVDAKNIVFTTLTALARDGKVEKDVLKKAIGELGLDPEKPNPAIS